MFSKMSRILGVSLGVCIIYLGIIVMGVLVCWTTVYAADPPTSISSGFGPGYGITSGTVDVKVDVNAERTRWTYTVTNNGLTFPHNAVCSDGTKADFLMGITEINLNSRWLTAEAPPNWAVPVSPCPDPLYCGHIGFFPGTVVPGYGPTLGMFPGDSGSFTITTCPTTIVPTSITVGTETALECSMPICCFASPEPFIQATIAGPAEKFCTGRPVMTIASGNNQRETIRKTLSQPLVVKVTDSAGNPPTSPVDVTFTVATQPQGRLVDAQLSDKKITILPGSKNASSRLTLGDATGNYTVTVSCAQCAPPDNTVTFTETAVCDVTPIGQSFYQVFDPQGNLEPWACELYSVSHPWITPSKACPLQPLGPNMRISQAGCGMVTLAMALDAAGASFTPSSLNGFMIFNVGDYDKANDVNWAVTVNDVRYLLKKNLVYHERISSEPKVLDTMLCGPGYPVQGYPVIVDVGSTSTHFVLVTGKTGAHYNIVDPGHIAYKTLDAYGNTFETRGYISDPPSTDWSSLHVSAANIEFLVTDPVGNNSGFDPTTQLDREDIPQSTYTRDGSDDGETGLPLPDVSRFLNVLEPLSGTYQVQVQGLTLGTYQGIVRVFSKDGSPQPALTFLGIGGPGTTTIFDVQSSYVPGSTSTIMVRATFSSTLDDINNSLKLGLIDNVGIVNSLSQKIQNADNAAMGGQTQTAKNILGAFKNEVNAQVGQHVMGVAVQVLLQDADSLLSQLH